MPLSLAYEWLPSLYLHVVCFSVCASLRFLSKDTSHIRLGSHPYYVILPNVKIPNDRSYVIIPLI